MPLRSVIHLFLSVEAASWDLVLYMHQQVEAELDKIKNHPDYTKVLSLDVSKTEPAVEPQSSSAARVFEEVKITGTKSHWKEATSVSSIKQVWKQGQ